MVQVVKIEVDLSFGYTQHGDWLCIDLLTISERQECNIIALNVIPLCLHVRLIQTADKCMKSHSTHSETLNYNVYFFKS